MKKYTAGLRCVICTLAIIGLATGCSTPSTSLKQNVTTYPDVRVITSRSEFQKAFDLQVLLIQPNLHITGTIKNNFLKVYTAVYKILLPKIEKTKIKIDENQLNSMVNQFKQTLIIYSYGGNEQKFLETMKQYHLTNSDLTAWARQTFYIENYVHTIRVKQPLESEMLNFYHKNHQAFTLVTVRQVMSPNIETVQTEIADLSQKSSPLVHQWTNMMVSSLPTPIQQTIMTEPLDHPSLPIRIGYDYVIAEVYQRKLEPFTAEKNRIEQLFISQEQEQAWSNIIKQQEKQDDATRQSVK